MGRRNGFPPDYRARSPIRKLAWLDGEECQAAVRARGVQMSQVSAERRRLLADSRRITRIVPSPCRRDEYESGYPFPPPADDPACQMFLATCYLHGSEKRMLWPTVYLSSEGATYDAACFDDDKRRQRCGLGGSGAQGTTTESPSAKALWELRLRGGIVESKISLETEDESELKRQIERYLAGKKHKPIRISTPHK